MTLKGHTSRVNSLIQLIDGRLVSESGDNTIKIWNMISISQQKWIRRRLLVLLFEASKILSEPPNQFEMISLNQYPRRHDLELLLKCVLNINTGIINLKTFKIILSVTSNTNRDIVQLIAVYL